MFKGETDNGHFPCPSNLKIGVIDAAATHFAYSFVGMTPRHSWRLLDMLSRTVMLWTSILDVHKPSQRKVPAL